MTRIASEDPEQARKDATARGLLDNYERAAVDVFEINGISDSWDEEEQQDIDAAKLEAADRLFRIRKRLFAMITASQADGLLVSPEALQAMCEEARHDEINRAADWMLTCAGKALDRAGSGDWEEAQFLFRYASLLRDMSPFPYTLKGRNT